MMAPLMLKAPLLSGPGPGGTRHKRCCLVLTSLHGISLLCGKTPLKEKSCWGSGSHLGVETTGGLQEERQVGLDLTAVGVGSVLCLALQHGDLIFERVVPPAGTRDPSSW